MPKNGRKLLRAASSGHHKSSLTKSQNPAAWDALGCTFVRSFLHLLCKQTLFKISLPCSDFTGVFFLISMGAISNLLGGARGNCFPRKKKVSVKKKVSLEKFKVPIVLKSFASHIVLRKVHGRADSASWSGKVLCKSKCTFLSIVWWFFLFLGGREYVQAC